MAGQRRRRQRGGSSAAVARLHGARSRWRGEGVGQRPARERATAACMALQQSGAAIAPRGQRSSLPAHRANACCSARLHSASVLCGSMVQEQCRLPQLHDAVCNLSEPSAGSATGASLPTSGFCMGLPAAELAADLETLPGLLPAPARSIAALRLSLAIMFEARLAQGALLKKASLRAASKGGSHLQRAV